MMLLVILGLLVIIGVPVFMAIFMTILGKLIGKEEHVDTSRKKKFQLIALSLLFSIIAVLIIFFILISIRDSTLDLSSS